MYVHKKIFFFILSNRIQIRSAGLFIFVEVYDLGLVLSWDGANRVYLKLKPVWKGRTLGLCGNYDEDTENDFK